VFRVAAAALVLLLAVTGYLAYRVVTLEHEVGALKKQLGAPSVAKAAAKTGTLAAQPGSSGNHEQRLAELEGALARLREDLQSLEEATSGMAAGPLDPLSGEQHILSVIERKQAHVLDRQLEFHRVRWVEWRAQALDNFAETVGLSPAQTERLHDLLAREVETMIGILKRPDVLENPEQSVSDWTAMLEETDRQARRLLEPAQVPAWDQARFLERKVLWPWLPDKP
jgi:hypothetical protein